MSTQLQPSAPKKLSLSAQLEDELLQLRQRRPVLTGEIAAATTDAEAHNAALASTGDPQHLDAAAASNARITALRGALSSLAEQLTAKGRELAEARAAEQWEATITRLIPIANAAASAVRLYEEHAAAANKILIEHVPPMAEAYRAWEAARKEFVAVVRALIPGVTPQVAGDLYGKLVTSPEAAAAGERLVKALEACCADVRPALAPVAGADLCIDLKTFQLDLPEPYSAMPHVLAQSLVAEQKKAEKSRASLSSERI